MPKALELDAQQGDVRWHVASLVGSTAHVRDAADPGHPGLPLTAGSAASEGLAASSRSSACSRTRESVWSSRSGSQSSGIGMRLRSKAYRIRDAVSVRFQTVIITGNVGVLLSLGGRTGRNRAEPVPLRGVPLQGAIAITDHGWYTFHAARPEITEVDFWTPSGRAGFRAEPFSPFLFKLKSPHNAICGFAYFAQYSRLPDWLAWETFESGNGALRPFGGGGSAGLDRLSRGREDLGVERGDGCRAPFATRRRATARRSSSRRASGKAPSASRFSKPTPGRAASLPSARYRLWRHRTSGPTHPPVRTRFRTACSSAPTCIASSTRATSP